MFSSEITIPNDTDQVVSIWVEPWAFSINVPPKGKCRLYADSEIKGEFETEQNNGTYKVFAWCGCNLKIYINDIQDLANNRENRVPGLPKDMSVKTFTEMVFASSSEKIINKKWWQFWL